MTNVTLVNVVPETLNIDDYMTVLELILKQQKWIAIDLYSNRYFFFIYKNKCYCVSELTLCFILASLSFFSTITVRLLIKRFQLKRKTTNLVKKLRGGNNQICYEPSLEEPFNDLNSIGFNDLGLMPFQNERLSEQEFYIKQIIRKCIKRNKVYRITSAKLINVIESMVRFNSDDKVKSISSELLTLALVISTSGPTKELLFGNLESFGKKFLPSFFIINGPLISAILIGTTIAWNVPLTSLLTTLRSYLLIFPHVFASYKLTAIMRAQFLIDCTDYVQELPTTQVVRVLPSPTAQNPDALKLSSKIEPYVREQPAKQDIFITTNQKVFNYQKDYELKDFKAEALDGVWKQQQTVDGQYLIGWSRNRDVERLVDSSRYSPLQTRTKHWCDVVKHDSTESRNSANRVIDTVARERFLEEVINESME